jgi:hypothetical protein
MSMMARMGEADIRLLGLEADSLEMSHIGAGINGTRPRTITNPSGRGDLCVADVGAHQANRCRAPRTDVITNTDIVAASGREVNQYTAPIESMSEAPDFLNNAYASLYEQPNHRTADRHRGQDDPGARGVPCSVSGKTGGQALHVTVSEDMGRRAVYLPRQLRSRGRCSGPHCRRREGERPRRAADRVLRPAERRVRAAR